MNPAHQHTRRRFFLEAAGSASVAALATVKSSGAEPARATTPPRTKIRIRTRISPAWLESADDTDLRFLKQIGVDAVDVELVMVKGYRETGRVTREALQALVDRFAAVGLRIERANALGDYILNAHLARPEGQ